ncbi:hypothetical protein C9374_005195 [Naegleria lovaniensis]|uniref:Cystatin domain-containing protein n=1 Tax=Naegleria lovaniensis TaxID=51637 RepID=A0AA88GLU6_NAELO|nr:uncharacterized protein C9374_005195 [Naegleria lovaniensis]KAG2382615.1 hypothetical protein C9374_005195 [Naegleria lovaniensis]
MKPGSIGNEHPADEEVKQVIDAVKGEVEQKLGKTLQKYEALKYATQVVAGTNYFVKVDTGDDVVHLRIYVHFSGSKQLHGVKTGETATSPIQHF